MSGSLADAEFLFAEHQQGVFRYLCRIVGRTEDARDLTQEVFLRVSRSPAPNGDSAGRRAWVFKIARNLALNYLRDTRHEAHTVELVESPEPAVQELGTAIHQALSGLADLDRDVFLLREIAGLNYEEIAGACELTVEAVRARLKRARQELRGALAGPIEIHRNRPVRWGHARFED